MPLAEATSSYISYILRSWQEGSHWRYSLEELGSGKRHGFASLDDLVSFLLARSIDRERSEETGDHLGPVA